MQLEQKNNSPKFIIVIGTSAGGIHSIKELVAGISPDTNAAFFVVIHLSQLKDRDAFIKSIQTFTSIKCKMAVDGENIQAGYLYMAEPNKHLLLKENVIIWGDGPAENRWRPSIDSLFRSAAAAYNSRVIGIILTGLMQDGVAGMIAIKKCGGTCIVQDPAQAEYPDMPTAVLDNVAVDYCVTLEKIPDLLLEMTMNTTPAPHPVPDEIKAEAKITERAVVDMDTLKGIGNHTLFTCPDCGGGLWEMKNENIRRFRCHTGHVYTQDEFERKQREAFESTMWVALRMMEERKQLMDKISTEEINKGFTTLAERRKRRSAELESHIQRLKELLFAAKE